jgi:DNA repair protein RecO (recombination protein O)
MLKLSRYLGFGVQHINEVIGGKIADEETERLLAHMLSAEYHDRLQMSNAQRRKLLDIILEFYREHMAQITEIKSLQILRDVLG